MTGDIVPELALLIRRHTRSCDNLIEVVETQYPLMDSEQRRYLAALLHSRREKTDPITTRIDAAVTDGTLERDLTMLTSLNNATIELIKEIL